MGGCRRGYGRKCHGHRLRGWGWFGMLAIPTIKGMNPIGLLWFSRILNNLATAKQHANRLLGMSLGRQKLGVHSGRLLHQFLKRNQGVCRW